MSLQAFDRVGSTNETILEVGATGAPEGTTHLASSQSRGRGRCGHVWHSPPGAGLWMSTLLRPTRERSAWGGIALVAGRAVQEALLELGVPRVLLYWPNDLQVGARKLGGILGETRAQGERAWVALGIGVNIDFGVDARRAIPEDVLRHSTTLVDSGEPSTTAPKDIAASILRHLWPLYDRFEGGEVLSRIVGDGLAHVGKAVEVLPPHGPPWKGVVRGLGTEGELLVESPGGTDKIKAVVAGKVVYEQEGV